MRVPKRLWRALIVVPVIVALLAVVGWLVNRGRGTGEAAERSDAEAVVTAPVERRVLETLQVTRGTVIVPSQATVRAPAPADGELAVVVTGTPLEQGAEVTAGAVVVELNGRPVFALPGDVPVYRDIRPGDAGPDVDALQDALQKMGYEIPGWERENKLFGRYTQLAVEKLYETAGFEPAYTLGSKAAVNQARSQAEEAVAAAQAALGATLESNSPEAAAAQSALNEAVAARDQVRSTEGIVLPVREFVAVPHLPAILVDLPVRAGQHVDVGEAVAQIGSSRFRVRLELTPAQVNELADDVEIAVFSDDGYEAICLPAEPRPAAAPEGEDGNAREGDEPGDDGDSGAEPSAGAPQADGSIMDVDCDPVPPAELVGASLRVTITVRRSEGEVLVVPATAVTSTSPTEAFVEVIGDDGEASRVTVSVGGEAEGFVEVTPVDGDELLDEGMNVRVRRG